MLHVKNMGWPGYEANIQCNHPTLPVVGVLTFLPIYSMTGIAYDAIKLMNKIRLMNKPIILLINNMAEQVNTGEGGIREGELDLSSLPKFLNQDGSNR
jgi:hypothetical protein